MDYRPDPHPASDIATLFYMRQNYNAVQALELTAAMKKAFPTVFGVENALI